MPLIIPTRAIVLDTSLPIISAGSKTQSYPLFQLCVVWSLIKSRLKVDLKHLSYLRAGKEIVYPSQ
jgi:hypothetical protein